MQTEVRGTGRPLLYLHPAGGVRWTPFLERLSATHAIHMPTFPGFDGTPLDPRIRDRRDIAIAAGRYIRGSIGRPCDVMGCSFGGGVALWLALEAPGEVDHLVLECPAGLQPIDPALRRDPAAFRKALYAHPEKVALEKKPETVQANNRRMLAHYGAEEGRDAALVERLDEIGHTTLIVHGTEDRIIDAESMRLLKSRLPAAFLVYVWDAAHGIELDQPERLAAVVQDFLARSESFVVPAPAR